MTESFEAGWRKLKFFLKIRNKKIWKPEKYTRGILATLRLKFIQFCKWNRKFSVERVIQWYLKLDHRENNYKLIKNNQHEFELALSCPTFRTIDSNPTWTMNGTRASWAFFRTSAFLSSKQAYRCGMHSFNSGGSFLELGNFSDNQPSSWKIEADCETLIISKTFLNLLFPQPWNVGTSFWWLDVPPDQTSLD